METLAGAFPEGVWSSLGGTYESDEANFMAQLLGKCQFSTEVGIDSVLGVQPSFWPRNGSSLDLSDTSGSAAPSSGILDPYLGGLYDSGTGVLFSGPSNHGNYYLDDSSPVLPTGSSSVAMDCCLDKDSSDRNLVMDSTVSMNQEMSRLDLRNFEAHGVEFSPVGDDIFSPVVLRKRSRSPEDLHEDKGGRLKVARRLDFSNQRQEEAYVASPTGPSSSPCTSQDDSGATCSSLSPKENVSNNNIVAQSPKGKARASRGSATDPQSLYARKRREKINERLRILQNLVPNGTKVDISTMLEEAVHYVKFLQLQIKLLSSDELWMYAPIAYNGMDIGQIDKIARGRQL